MSSAKCYRCKGTGRVKDSGLALALLPGTETKCPECLGRVRLDFDLLRAANNERQGVWPGADMVDLGFRAIEVGEEGGELLGAVKKYLRAARGIAGTTKTLTDIADEAGDVVIAVDLLCMSLGIDLAAAVRAKFNKTSLKYKLPVFIGVPEE